MSSATRNTSSAFSQAARSLILNNIDWIAELNVSDGDHVQAKELNCTRDQFLNIARSGAWPIAETSPGDTHTWRVPRGWEQAVEEARKQATLLPCGHRPFKNPRDVDGYTCLDECGAVYPREEIREVLG